MTVEVSLNEVQAKLDAAPAGSLEAETIQLYLEWLRRSREADNLNQTTTCRDDNVQDYVRWMCCDAHRALSARADAGSVAAVELAAKSDKAIPGGAQPQSQVWWQTLGIDHPLNYTVVD